MLTTATQSRVWTSWSFESFTVGPLSLRRSDPAGGDVLRQVQVLPHVTRDVGARLEGRLDGHGRVDRPLGVHRVLLPAAPDRVGGRVEAGDGRVLDEERGLVG